MQTQPLALLAMTELLNQGKREKRYTKASTTIRDSYREPNAAQGREPNAAYGEQTNRVKEVSKP